MNIEVTRQPNDLTRWTWRFWYFDNRKALVLDSYSTATRSTKRHKFRVVEWYSRLSAHGHNLQEADVVMPADVTAEARQRFIEGLRVVRWSEVK